MSEARRAMRDSEDDRGEPAKRSKADRDKAPSAEEIEARFGGLTIRVTRPVALLGVEALKLAARFRWDAAFEHELHRIGAPMIFASNHRSHVDTGAILGTLPRFIARRTVVAAALDVFGSDCGNGLKRRVLSSGLQLVVGAGFHAFAFDRFGPPLRSVRTSVQLIRNGWSLMLYPEGTRSRTGELSEFKAGVALLARFTDRPVIPVHVEGGDAVLPYGRFWPHPGRVHVRYGPPLWYQPDDTPLGFAAKVREAVRQLGLRQAGVRKPGERSSGTRAIEATAMPSSSPTGARQQPT
jgi:1-acyl-sn-glycerol-3-phosphate acyltransferase